MSTYELVALVVALGSLVATSITAFAFRTPSDALLVAVVGLVGALAIFLGGRFTLSVGSPEGRKTHVSVNGQNSGRDSK